jgi:hypothetical protein
MYILLTINKLLVMLVILSKPLNHTLKKLQICKVLHLHCKSGLDASFRRAILVNMANVLETIFESAGNDIRQATLYDFSTIKLSAPRFGGLTTLYRIWNTLRGDAIAPDASHFASNCLAIMDSRLTMTLIDVSNPNPWWFRFLGKHSLGGTRVTEGDADDFLKDVPCPMTSRALIRTCMKIRETRQPVYNEISKTTLGGDYQLLQLSLPLFTEDAVSGVILGTRKL